MPELADSMVELEISLWALSKALDIADALSAFATRFPTGSRGSLLSVCQILAPSRYLS